MRHIDINVDELIDAIDTGISEVEYQCEKVNVLIGVIAGVRVSLVLDDEGEDLYDNDLNREIIKERFINTPWAVRRA